MGEDDTVPLLSQGVHSLHLDATSPLSPSLFSTNINNSENHEHSCLKMLGPPSPLFASSSHSYLPTLVFTYASALASTLLRQEVLFGTVGLDRNLLFGPE